MGRRSNQEKAVEAAEAVPPFGAEKFGVALNEAKFGPTGFGKWLEAAWNAAQKEERVRCQEIANKYANTSDEENKVAALISREIASGNP